MASEKSGTLLPSAAPRPEAKAAKRSWSRGTFLLLFYLCVIYVYAGPIADGILWLKDELTSDNVKSSNQCPQVKPLLPTAETPKLLEMDAFLASKKFENASIARMTGAIQIPSESFDDLGPVGEDSRWEIFYDFQAYVKKTFPLVHEKLELEVVNEHGLYYTWKGSNPALKPTLLMAHQDVVPVAKSTVNAWTHPPFSGYYDGKSIWGRGSVDCKNNLIGILEAVEELLAADFAPKRTVLLSFGFDEEISGRQGAQRLAQHILDKLGKDSISVIVDEGAGNANLFGATFAAPAIGEKGYIDVDITVRMPGGHSSVPPRHTGIGVISELITHIEKDEYPANLRDEHPILTQLECAAEYAPSFPKKLKKLLSKSRKSSKKDPNREKLANEIAGLSPLLKYVVKTSQAVDIIEGGVKINALPERTKVQVNHRVNVGEHPSAVKAKLTHLAGKVAKKYNLTLHAFEDIEETPSSITLSAKEDTILEPAPVTPTSLDEYSPWAVLSGTTRGLYGQSMILAPGIMTGNTDTRYYWDLSRHIYRYGPGYDDSTQGDLVDWGVHTVDEHVSVKIHITTVQWFSLFIRNMDEAPLA